MKNSDNGFSHGGSEGKNLKLLLLSLLAVLLHLLLWGGILLGFYKSPWFFALSGAAFLLLAVLYIGARRTAWR